MLRQIPKQILRSWVMQQPSSNCPQFHGLSIELTGIPLLDSPNDTPFLDLNLTLHFQEVWQEVLGGRFKYGLTGGKLMLILENATLPDGMGLLTELAEISSEQSPSISCQVTTGTPSPCHLSLEIAGDGSILRGDLGLLKLARLKVQEPPVRVQATFQVSEANIQMVESEGLWPHDINPNQHGILERMLIRSLVTTQFQPYLTQAELHYAGSLEAPTAVETASPLHDLAPIGEEIAPILATTTENFIELANRAGLDPARDFVGAKLWGCNLRGLDLSGAQLPGVKLRGADLSDVDLSEANLTGANLAGADASGALLSDANLSHADLHRCSLALASLSGATLRNANLQEANLSNANLSDADLSGANLSGADLHQAGLVMTNLTNTNLTGANVNQARFKLDSGLSAEMERDLKARGAIFEP
jgi:uncharacterized protein YjbI with pentapeptide repeats